MNGFIVGVCVSGWVDVCVSKWVGGACVSGWVVHVLVGGV